MWEIRWLYAVLLVAALSGCATLDPPARVVEDEPVIVTPVAENLEDVIDSMVAEMIKSPLLAAQEGFSVMMLAEINNRSDLDIEVDSLQQHVRTTLFRSGKLQFVNEQRLQGLMESHAEEEMTTASLIGIAQQLGARYLLTTTLREIENDGRQVVGENMRRCRLEMNLIDLMEEGESVAVEREFWMLALPARS